MLEKNDKGKYGVDLGSRGIFDKRNKLNDLTGKEWVYFTNSVWITGYSPTAIENVGLKYRKIHPSPKPPGLMKDIIEFFTKSNSLILDPFVGVGGTLLGTALAGDGRKAIGIDLEKKYKDAYIKACESEKLEKMEFIIGDSKSVLQKLKSEKYKFDLVIADPPYSDMMSRSRTGQRLKLHNKASPTPYTNESLDLGNMSKEDFLESLKIIIKDCSELLKDGKYIVIFCKDFQPNGKNVNLLHCEVVNKINEIDELEYRGMRIWHDQAMSLYPFGYPFTFVMNQIHQYILIFRKVQHAKN